MVQLPRPEFFNDKITSHIYCIIQTRRRILGLDQGYSVPEAGRSLDVGETMLRRWGQSNSNPNAISQALTPDQQKIQDLEARTNRLER